MKRKVTLTAKEFKQILTDAGIDFDIFGYEGILNLVSMCYDFKAEAHEKEGCTVLQQMEEERAHKIYNALYKIGYYI